MAEPSAARPGDAVYPEAVQPPDTTATIDRPVRARDRLTHVDALRGVALLGILVVNLLAFSAPSFLYTEPLSWWEGADRWVEWVVLVTAEGAFITIFSVLFGWGFGRWMRTRGAGAAGRFARRLAWLLVLGLVHMFGIWTGDILVHYALIGFLLLPFARAGARSLALAGVGFWVVGVLLFAGARGDEGSTESGRWVTLYGEGGFGTILTARLEQGESALWSVLAYLPLTLGMFLIGAALAKSRAFGGVVDSSFVRAWWRRGAWLALAGGVIFKARYGVQLLAGDTDRLLLSTALGGPLLGLGYLAVLTLWFTGDSGALVAATRGALAAAGRTALTVYLTQSVVMTLLFYGYGLGWYGRVGPAVGVPLALGVFAVQVVVARWWLARFRFGPVEWLWRSLTYGRPQAWRRS